MAKAYAIHVGLEQVDDARYAREYQRQMARLPKSADDANMLAEITRSQGFTEVFVRINKEATREEFVTLLATCISKLEAGDLLVISFSGHGGQALNVADNDEPYDGKDEFWCFYDDILVDDMFYYYLCQAPKESRLLVIADSCHGGGMYRFDDDLLILPPGKFTKERRIKNYQGELDGEVVASVIFWGAVRPEKKAGNGLFSQTLAKLWKKDAGKMNYLRFYEKLKRKSNPKYIPHQAIRINSDEFEKEKPFFFT